MSCVTKIKLGCLIMANTIDINKDILTWAINRAGYSVDSFALKFPNIEKWLSGEKKPTLKQLEDFAKKVYLPFGYLFLDEPPLESIPIPFFRSNKSTNQISINLFDTLMMVKERQEWLKEHLIKNDFDKLDFVAKYSSEDNFREIASDMRSALGLEKEWAKSAENWESALNLLVQKIEDLGIIVVFNGVVGNNTHRNVSTDECRGFVLVDEYAPFLFVNNADFKSAQMFTLAHELAHIWIGKSAGFDLEKMLPANDPIEILCNKVAAEFLVPEDEFRANWHAKLDIITLAKLFKVSTIVIARRAFDLGVWEREEFFDFYNDYKNREFGKKSRPSSGGDFYATAKKRLSQTFMSHVKYAVKSNQLLYRDAYRLTGLKGNTMETFFNKF